MSAALRLAQTFGGAVISACPVLDSSRTAIAPQTPLGRRQYQRLAQLGRGLMETLLHTANFPTSLREVKQ